MPEQVQDFYPTPSTLSTVMYYTGLDPRDMKPVYVCRNPHEKAMQRALIQYRNPKNYDYVYEALVAAGRTDLIGFDKKCLIRPRHNSDSLGQKRAFSSNAGKNADRSGKESYKKTDKGVGKKKKTIRNVHKKK
jgi:hypothetical protein